MMTSVTLPSTSGPLHGGYSSVAEETTSSEPEFETPRPVKRCLIATPLTDSCKKRRKQSTPIRISAADAELLEGKPCSTSPETESQQLHHQQEQQQQQQQQQCPMCQQYFNNTEQLQKHILSEHASIECKKEPEEFAVNQQCDRSNTPLELTSSNRPEVAWMNELQNKEWMNPNLHGLSFNTGNPIFMTLPQFTQNENMPRQPIRIFNPDAYCDLCNKEFCNKYFLKTHKANKHGIYSDPPSTEPLVNNVTSSYTGTIKLPTSVPSVEISKNEPKTPSTPIINPFNNIFPSPFSNKSFINTKINKSNIQNLYEISETSENVPNSNGFSSNSESDNKISSDEQIAHDELMSTSPNNNNTQTESTSFKNIDPDGIYYIQQSKLSPGNDLDISNRLRRIGVMNPKAFCEICCKEYCNKYFLRTHKMKRHGIYIPDDKDTKLDSGQLSWQTNNMQTSPLNLILTEQSNSDRKTTTSPSDISCEICGIKFQNASLSQLHNISVHSIKLKQEKIDDDDNNNDNDDNEDDDDIDAEAAVGDDNTNDDDDDDNVDNDNDRVHDQHQNNDETTTRKDIIISDSNNIVPLITTITTPTLTIITTTMTTATTTITTTTTTEKMLNSEAISEDLQKLQTMILQLNELDVSKTCTTCNACNKEFENRYFLHAHMMAEHGILLDDLSDIDKTTENDNNSSNNTACELCGKDVQNVEEMRKHITEVHSNHQQQQQPHQQPQQQLDNVKDEFNNFNTNEKNLNRPPTSTERRISMNITPTSSYCDICNKELCNKYFMKTHMQRMHGIEIENGAQIGGVICDICNKELCSKYFLRVHKHNTHGIVEYSSSLLQPRKTDGDNTTTSTPTTTTPITSQLSNETDPALKPADLADLSHRYFTHFTEVCSICNRRFRSTKWLKAHLLSDHGQIGAEKWAELEQQLQQNIGNVKTKSERNSPTLKIPNGGGQDNQKVGIQNVLSSLFGVDETSGKSYQCSYCPFTTPLLPLLFVHERSHSMSTDGGTVKCPVCGQNFLQPELLQHHIFTSHPFLPLPPLFNGSEVEMIKELSDIPEDEVKDDNSKGKKKGRGGRRDLAPEVTASLKDVVKRVQMPATYALPQTDETGHMMQAFLMEDTASDKRILPAVVFLPVLQKQLAPLTVTFTLTPA